MTLTLELPPEVEDRVRRIPDLQERVILFVRGLAGEMEPAPPPGAVRIPTNAKELEEWRKQRYSAEAIRMVEEGFAEGDRRISEGMTREEAVRLFRDVQERIAAQLP